MTDLHPVLAEHGSFAHLPLGRLPSRHDPRQLMLAKYLRAAALPTPPPAYDLTTAVPSWPMYGNDRLGDCTLAALAHLIQGWTANASLEVTPNDSVVEEGYWLTGTPPSTTGQAGGPTDDGRVETDVLSWWRNTGLAGDKITAYVALDPSDLDQVRLAVWLFGGVYLGVALPITAQTQQVWDVVDPALTGDSEPGSWGGHAVPELAYGDDGLTIVTWGGTLRMTEAFHKAYVEEAYAIISPDWLKDGHTPAGFDIDALNADLAAIGNQPAPDPGPGPAPAPTGADVQAKLTAATHELGLTQVGHVGWLERVRDGVYDPEDGSGTHWGKAQALIDDAYELAGQL